MVRTIIQIYDKENSLSVSNRLFIHILSTFSNENTFFQYRNLYIKITHIIFKFILNKYHILNR